MPKKAVYVLAAAACLTPWASPAAALTLGIVLALSLDNPFAAEGRKFSKPLLQTCVVLLGFAMDLNEMLRAGARGIVFAAATISATLILGFLLSRWLKIPGRISALISSGTAICGGSAIAAVATVLGAEAQEISVAIGTVFLLNGAALYLFPPLGHILHLTQQQFGTWAGVAIHDISSVVGAGSIYGAEALRVATAVKLSRVLWIVPIAAGAHAIFRIPRSSSAETNQKLPVPWFIGLFLLASVARSFVPAIASAAPVITRISRAGFALTLFLIGAGMSRASIRAVGWRPFLQGFLLWLFIAGTSLAVVTHV